MEVCLFWFFSKGKETCNFDFVPYVMGYSNEAVGKNKHAKLYAFAGLGFATCWIQGSHLREKTAFFTQNKSRLRKSENAVRLLYAKKQ